MSNEGDGPVGVLFLCTGNSARSILAEALLNARGKGRFRAFSAGSFPKGRVHPGALAWLDAHGFETGALRSKSWDEFAAPDGSRIDLVITVCDNAAGETCPVWPGRPVSAHWGLPDPDGAGDAATTRAAFARTAERLARRIDALAALPGDQIEARAVQAIHDTLNTTQEG